MLAGWISLHGLCLIVVVPPVPALLENAVLIFSSWRPEDIPTRPHQRTARWSVESIR
jgi:hypothetical protein